MLYRLRNRLTGEEGFTLVELLVVILIIGILAAIAIPSFLNQKGKGEDAAAKSSAREASTAVETYYTDNATYGASSTSGGNDDLHKIEPTLPAGTSTSTRAASTTEAGKLYISGNQTSYTIRVWSKPSGRMFEIVKDTNGVTRSCLPAGDGGCNSTGSW